MGAFWEEAVEKRTQMLPNQPKNREEKEALGRFSLEPGGRDALLLLGTDALHLSTLVFREFAPDHAHPKSLSLI